jgi:hypothetical protein
VCVWTQAQQARMDAGAERQREEGAALSAREESLSKQRQELDQRRAQVGVALLATAYPSTATPRHAPAAVRGPCLHSVCWALRGDDDERL